MELVCSSGGFAVLTMFMSYGFALYAYAIFYVFVSAWNREAFNVPISFGDAMYFSVVTSATVGFGDIIPKSGAAKFLVCTEILLSIAYVVILFSVASSYLREARANSVNKLNGVAGNAKQPKIE